MFPSLRKILGLALGEVCTYLCHIIKNIEIHERNNV